MKHGVPSNHPGAVNTVALPAFVDLTDENTLPSIYAPSSLGVASAPKKTAPKKLKAHAADDIEKLYDVSQIHLEGEEDGTVPIYDSCNDIRKKIRAFLRRKGVTQAAFLRALANCRPGGGPPISASSFQMFMRQTRIGGGTGSPVFYTAYVFFEKMRLRDGKPKTKRREEMERVWGDWEDWRTGRRGFADLGRGITCHVSEVPVLDEYGMVHIRKKGTV